MELEIQEDDVNRENGIDEDRKGYKSSFSNTKLPVTKEYLEDITNKRMVSDNVIHGFNILCRRQFEHVAGLQDPLTLSNIPILSNKKSEICANFP